MVKLGDETPWLTIRSQSSFPMEAEIVGTKAGLRAVIAAVSDALSGGSGESGAFASDGEGYLVKARRSSSVNGIGAPFYVDRIAEITAQREHDFIVSHYKLIRRQSAEALEALTWCRANGNPHHNPTIPKTDTEAA